MTTTEFEGVPAVAGDEVRPPTGLVVMKFGGTSVATPERLQAVARGSCTPGGRPTGRRRAVRDGLDDRRAVRPRTLGLTLSQPARARHARLHGRADLLRAVRHGDHRPRASAVSLTGTQAGIVTDTAHGKAKIVEVRARRIHDALDQGTIVLVAGFQGVSTEYEVTTLGRGASDTTAVALAAALAADACEIYTDVEGVYTADPRSFPGRESSMRSPTTRCWRWQRRAPKVIALRSVELARNHGVRLHVRSTFSDEDGTWVAEEDERMLEKAMISGVTHTLEETLYRVDGVPAARLFAALAAAQVNVDTILQTGAEIVFSAPTTDRAPATGVLDELGATWSATDELGKVSVVGAGMKSHPGVAATTFSTLDAAGIEPQIVTTSPIKIACHVAREDVDRAVQVLHEAFGLSSEAAERAHA